ncbi:Pimeloyl-ACP methyl ester carboxylesterase [Methylobacterium sp. UNC300MFChir4.1]|uniref:alpha/beta fold hydrolase n=1 Tax=Methylobacterium sp. UNC300MFChir4.1 TaxID=1502747 RepID=UPI0008B9873C|nr:alpha/beta hydrolase [Methylobacterium sp. UNC300MFChir4.1]SEO61052.1 Pimeloyl-ACP methyl ester carboxylesterase [Methylobacterium sp. UNC300MFChir4.1]
MKRVRAGVLEVAYLESGPADGPTAVLLHGFPYDVHACAAAAAQLAADGVRCLVPYLRGYGPTRFLDAATPRCGEQAALGADLLAFLDALGVGSAVLAGYDWGGRAACVVAALWPDRARGLVSCGVGYNIQNIPAAGRPAAPETEHRLWYQYYLHGERGRAGLAENRDAFCRLLWQLWSPTWAFDAETFARTARAFDNPDFVDVVVHSYRHRFGLVSSDPALVAIEGRLAAQPAIAVPSIVLLGADDGVGPPPATDTDARRFTGPYRREIVAGVGHNFPQEAPDAFAAAIRALL